MIKILELFGGIGACSKALERLGIEYEIADYVEIDKYAVKSFNAIHNTSFEPQDICEWDKDIEVDLIMHGSPCQDFSLAGKQAGGDKDSGTRSSLMYETIRIVEKLKPKYVIWENVKNLLSKKHIHNFNAYLETMEQLGYYSYYQVLNAKDYGIPQNRERVFTISIRKDINKVFTFPQPQELKLKLKDILEDEVDEKYIISDALMKYYGKKIEQGWRKELHLDNKEVSSTICNPSRNNINDTFVRCQQVGNLTGGKWDKINESCRRVYSEEGISPTIHTCQGGNTEPKVVLGAARRKRENGQQVEISNREYSNAITTIQTDALICEKEENMNDIIKQLDNLCARLQGDYGGGEPFEQDEEDRLVIYNVIEILETLRKYIKFERSTYPCNDTLDHFLEILDGKHLGKKWEDIRNGIEY